MTRSFAVFALVSAGVFQLAGPGWACLAAAGLVVGLWRREPEWKPLAARAAARYRVVVAGVRSAPRRVSALTGMTGGLVLVPAGLALSAGAGVAVVAAGVLLIGVALLTGWGA